jgi:hypothetical protein
MGVVGRILCGPIFGRIGPQFEHHMQMVAHHRVAHDRDGEEIGEEGDAVLDSLAAVVEVLA